MHTTWREIKVKKFLGVKDRDKYKSDYIKEAVKEGITKEEAEEMFDVTRTME